MYCALCCTHWIASKGLEVPVKAGIEGLCQGSGSRLKGEAIAAAGIRRYIQEPAGINEGLVLLQVWRPCPATEALMLSGKRLAQGAIPRNQPASMKAFLQIWAPRTAKKASLFPRPLQHLLLSAPSVGITITETEKLWTRQTLLIGLAGHVVCR